MRFETEWSDRLFETGILSNDLKQVRQSVMGIREEEPCRQREQLVQRPQAAACMVRVRGPSGSLCQRGKVADVPWQSPRTAWALSGHLPDSSCAAWGLRPQW